MAELRAYDGVPVDELATRTGAARVHAFDVVESTMDVAHSLARDGAPHGTVVLADAQVAGRGRERREWQSPAGGVWMTVVLRGVEQSSLGVLPLRVGVASAAALDALAPRRIGLKWPNDLYLDDGKLGGSLVEARWRGDQLDWVAVGIGINLEPPPVPGSAGLGESIRRAAVVERVIPAVLRAAARSGALTDAELSDFEARDIARGRTVTSPVAGVVLGIDSAGALRIDTASGVETIRSGSVVFSSVSASLSANG